ncbi:MAG: hypothetical protein M0Q41_05540 [Bacteroidales bacterium]|nr:hypothetical protein [Bacteroidales bacterium]
MSKKSRHPFRHKDTKAKSPKKTAILNPSRVFTIPTKNKVIFQVFHYLLKRIKNKWCCINHSADRIFTTLALI